MSKSRTVLVFGTYDVFHKGHEYFLHAAKQYGDRLVVIVARDANVEKMKGRKPYDSEETRKYKVQQCDVVDDARLGYEDWSHHEQVLVDIQPDVICLGYDQQANIPQGPWKVVRIGSFKPEKYKSSLLRPQKNLQ